MIKLTDLLENEKPLNEGPSNMYFAFHKDGAEPNQLFDISGDSKDEAEKKIKLALLNIEETDEGVKEKVRAEIEAGTDEGFRVENGWAEYNNNRYKEFSYYQPENLGTRIKQN